MTTDPTKTTALANYTPMSLDDLEDQEKQIGFGSGTGQFFAFKDGKNVIRWLPGLHGQKAFVPFWKHFVKGAADGKAYGGPCPLKMAKQPCITCMVAAKLSRGTDADRDLSSELNPRSRVVGNLVDRSAPDAGPQMAEFGKSIYDAVKDYLRTMGEDPTHPIDGFDMIIEKTGSGLKTEYKTTAVRKNSPLHPDAKQMTEWLNDARDLGSVVILPTEAEQAQRLAGTIIGHLLGSRGGAAQPTTQRARASAAMAVDANGDDDLPY